MQKLCLNFHHVSHLLSLPVWYRRWRIPSTFHHLLKKTNGVNDPLSTSCTLELYWIFFSFSLISKALFKVDFKWRLANGLNTLTTKNACLPRIQKSRAVISNLASSLLFAAFTNISPVKGCNTDYIAYLR